MPDITAARPVSGTPIETGWGDQVHDMLEGIQAGKGSLVWSASADSAVVAVTFPRAYTAPPVVVVSLETGITRGCVAKVSSASVTATGFTATGQNTAGASISGTIAYTWVAIGTPA